MTGLFMRRIWGLTRSRLVRIWSDITRTRHGALLMTIGMQMYQVAVTECLREVNKARAAPFHLLNVLFTHHRTESTGCCLIFRKSRVILHRRRDSVCRLAS